MTVAESLSKKLKDSFQPSHLEILDESHKHSGNRVESHFQIILVSEEFQGLSSIKRHQSVYKVLAFELKNQIHALALRTYTEEEWKEESSPLMTPDCGGKKAQ